jgi:hypothetical protein
LGAISSVWTSLDFEFITVASSGTFWRKLMAKKGKKLGKAKGLGKVSNTTVKKVY